MELCDSGHDQVCFEYRRNGCPVCEIQAAAAEKERELERKISDLEDTIANSDS